MPGKVLKNHLIPFYALATKEGRKATLSGAIAFVASGFNYFAAGAAFTGTLLSELQRQKNEDALKSAASILNTTANQASPRRILYGKAATGGEIVYQENHDNNGAWETDQGLSMVIALAGHQITSLESFLWGGTAITFSSNNAVGDLNNYMFLYEHLGANDQAVDSTLNTNSSDWGTNDRLRFIAYVHLMIRASNEKFPNGLEEMRFTAKGRKVYDPRLDSTNGGSGAHRLTNPSTWAWSDNPVLCIVDYMRGIRTDDYGDTTYAGTLIAGMEIADANFDWATIRAEADVCDESVNLDGGGSENRYTLNGYIDPSRTHRENLQVMASSMAGNVVFQSGKWRVYAGTTRTASKTRTTDHLAGGISMSAQKSISERVNSIKGSFISAADDYEPRGYPPLQNSTYVTEDGGAALWQELDFPLTTSGTMVQRLSKIAMERSRLDRVLDVTFKIIALQDTVMDAVTFTYSPFGLSSQKFLVADWNMKFAPDAAGNTSVTINETLIEEADAIYDWDETTEEQAITALTVVSKDDALNNQLTLPALTTTVAVSGNPLTAADVGATATITIAAWTGHLGTGLSISFNSGSVAGLAFSTTFYVYADDPNREGGAVTYTATTTKTDIGDNDGRIFIGTVVTPADGGGGTSGSPIGGLGGGGIQD